MTQRFKMLVYFIMIFVMMILCVSTKHMLYETASSYAVFLTEEQMTIVRKQLITNSCLEFLREQAAAANVDFYSLLAAAFYVEQGMLNDTTTLKKHLGDYKEILEHHKERDEFICYRNLFSGIWQDLEVFPVPDSVNETKHAVDYEDSWMFERNFSKKRGHEGCDLMPIKNKAGYYPVLSMSEGTVEKIGWLTLGGYRVGIRTKHGAYLYYAHLHSYAASLYEGKVVHAGELLGYMGDSGYGEEGTCGMFPVHLHIGIYLTMDASEQISINPYYPLKSLEGKRIRYQY